MIRHAALTSTDALFGFQKIVRAAWFFPGAIDAEMLRGALDEFGDAHPIFRGRVCRRAPPSRNVNLNLLQMCAPPRPPFSDYSVRGRPSEEARIPLFVHELDGVDPGNGYADVREEDVLRGSGNTTYLPDDIMRGVAPCMQVSLTHLNLRHQQQQQHHHDQSLMGSVVAVGMSHAVVDASGMHMAVAELARMYRSRVLLEEADRLPYLKSPPPKLSASRTPILDAMRKHSIDPSRKGSTRPSHPRRLDLSGYRGNALWFFIRRMQRSQIAPAHLPRARLSFSRHELDALQQRTPRANNAAEALCGRLLCELTRGAEGIAAVRVEMPVDMRRVIHQSTAGCFGNGEYYTGNAVHVVAAKGLVRLAIGEAILSPSSAAKVTDAFVRELQALTQSLRDDPESVVAEWLDRAQILDEGIVVGSRTAGEEGAITLVVNSHRRLAGATTLLPGLDLFGAAAGACARFVPGQSDAVQLLPGVGDNEGGVDVLVSLPMALRTPAERSSAPTTGDWVARLESERFRQRLLCGGSLSDVDDV